MNLNETSSAQAPESAPAQSQTTPNEQVPTSTATASAPPPQETKPPERQMSEQDLQRAAIYQKHYESTQIPMENEPTQVMDGAVGEQPTQASPTTPQPVEQPSTNTNSSDLKAELEEVKQLLLQQQSQRSQTSQESLEPTPQVEDNDEDDSAQEWIELYKQGRVKEGAQALAKIVQQYAPTRDTDRQQTMMETVQFLEAKNTMTNAAAEAARLHPELKDMEPYIKAAIDADMGKAQQDGLVKNYSDYARVYVESLNNHVNSASKIAQSLRATGAESAAVRTSEVISSSIVTPSQVTPFGQGEPKETPAPPTNPYQSYLEARRSRQLARDGMRLS